MMSNVGVSKLVQFFFDLHDFFFFFRLSGEEGYFFASSHQDLSVFLHLYIARDIFLYFD